MKASAARFIYPLIAAVIVGPLSSAPFASLATESVSFAYYLDVAGSIRNIIGNIVVWFVIFFLLRHWILQLYLKDKKKGVFISIGAAIVLFVIMVWYRENWGVEFW